MSALAPPPPIGERIVVLRGQRAMLDADLAAVCGVTTKRLNEQVKRNRNRFPADFMFQLTDDEKAHVVANCDHMERLKYGPEVDFFLGPWRAITARISKECGSCVDASK